MVFIRKWQFWLKNENFEISRNSAYLWLIINESLMMTVNSSKLGIACLKRKKLKNQIWKNAASKNYRPFIALNLSSIAPPHTAPFNLPPTPLYLNTYAISSSRSRYMLWWDTCSWKGQLERTRSWKVLSWKKREVGKF